MAEAVVHFQLGGRGFLFVLNFLKSDGYDQTDIDNLAAAVDGWVNSEVLAFMNVNTSYIRTDVRGLESATDLFATNNTGASVEAISGAATVANCAIVVTHRSALTGRSARGRTYVAGFSAAVLTTSTTFDASFIPDLEDAFNALRPAVLAADWVFVVLSRYTSNAPRPVAVAYIVVESVVRNNYLDSMSRRLRPDR